jgi:hypothetical protein
MSKMPRLLMHGADDFERALLRSASHDAGSSRARARCLAAAAGVSVISGAAASAASVSTAVLVKWVGVGVVAGLGTLGAVQGGTYVAHALSSRPAPSARAMTDRHAVASVAEKGSPVAVLTPAPTPSVRLPDVAQPEPGSQSLARNSLRTAPDDAPQSSVEAAPPTEDHALDREVALLDRARAALSRGDATRALSLLKARQEQFPRGALGPEAALTRVKALLTLGDRGAAEAEARHLEQFQPGGAHASRARQLVEQAANKP